MWGTIGRRGVTGICGLVLRTALFVLIAWVSWNAPRVAADQGTYRSKQSELRQATQADTRVAALYQKGEYRQAVEFAVRSLQIRLRILGEQHLGTATSLNNLAVLYGYLGAYQQAEPLYRRALAIRKRLLGPNHLDTAHSLNNLGIVYWSLAQYAKAEPLYLQALQIRMKVLGENHPDTASSLNNLAELYESTGDYAKAEPLLLKALEISKRVRGENDSETATSINNLGGLYRAMADYAKAEPLLLKALEINRRVRGENDADTATSLNNLGELYNSMGDYAKAESLLWQAMRIRLKVQGGMHPDIASNALNLADVYWRMGDYGKAEELFREALEIRKKVLGVEHPETAASLDGVASVYAAKGDYAKAESLYQQALEIRKKVLGEKHPDTAKSLQGLASVYEKTADYAKAEPLLLQALEIRKNVFGENHPDTAGSLADLGLLYWLMGDSARAEPLYRRALEINKQALGEKHPYIATRINDLGMLYWSMGDYAKAEPLCRKALEIYEDHFAFILRGQSQRQQIAFAQKLRISFDCYLSIAPQFDAKTDDIYRHLLNWKGAIFLRQFGSRVARHSRPELRSRFEALQSLSLRLANLAWSVPKAQQSATWQRQLAELTVQKEVLEQELSRDSEAYRQQRAILELTPAQLQQALPKGTALLDVLEYTHVDPPVGGRGVLRHERRLAAFVVRPASIKLVDLGPIGPIDDAIRRWRRSYGRSGASDPAKELQIRIWKPLEPLLAGAETILFSPDGALCQLPLGALPGSKPDTYLIEERNIVVLPAPHLLRQLLVGGDADAPANGLNTPLLIGAVEFGDAPGPVSVTQTDVSADGQRHRSAERRAGRGDFVFGPLPETGREIEAIRAVYEQVFGQRALVVRGAEATKELFRTEAPRHRWVHVATHGFFAPESVRSAFAPEEVDPRPELVRFADMIRGINPGLLSGIALAGANRDAVGQESGDDGILTALEVEGLDLGQVDLVVLSACETGLGRVAGGEGVLGLQRAFHSAGAKTAVTSLWKVDDTATQLLMTEFYTNLWQKKLGKLDALRRAQLRMLREYDPKQMKFVSRGLHRPARESLGTERGSPFYWAGFVLSGDWR